MTDVLVLVALPVLQLAGLVLVGWICRTDKKGVKDE